MNKSFKNKLQRFKIRSDTNVIFFKLSINYEINWVKLLSFITLWLAIYNITSVMKPYMFMVKLRININQVKISGNQCVHNKFNYERTS